MFGCSCMPEDQKEHLVSALAHDRLQFRWLLVLSIRTNISFWLEITEYEQIKMTAMVSDFRRIKKADMAWSRPSHQDLPFASNPAIALHFADSQRGRLGEASKMMSTVKMWKEFDIAVHLKHERSITDFQLPFEKRNGAKGGPWWLTHSSFDKIDSNRGRQLRHFLVAKFKIPKLSHRMRILHAY